MMDDGRSEARQQAILAVLVAFAVIGGLGGMPLFDRDEGAFSEATREMVSSGNYLMTYLNGEPRYDKPILIYWFQAVSMHIFGVNAFAVRFPSAVAAALWALITYRFTKRHFGAPSAFPAAFMLVAAIQINLIAKAAIADALLNLLLAATMFQAYAYYESARKRDLHLAAVMMALGMLTKGPVAVLIPLGASFIFCWSNKELKRWLHAVFNPAAIAIFLIISAPWYIYAIATQGSAYLDQFWLKHNVKRFTTPLEGHGGSLLYYCFVVPIGLLPYTALLFKALRRTKIYWGAPETRFLLAWFFFVFVFFSLSGTKLHHYVIYGYTPMLILMALELPRVRHPFLLALPALLLMGVLLLLPGTLPWVAGRVNDAFAAQVVSEAGPYFDARYMAGMTIAFIALLGIAFAPRIPIAARLVGMGIIVLLALNCCVGPVVSALQQGPVVEAAAIAKAHDYDVVLWEADNPSFAFYQEKASMVRAPKDGDIVFTKKICLERLEEYETLFERHGLALVRVIHAGEGAAQTVEGMPRNMK